MKHLYIHITCILVLTMAPAYADRPKITITTSQYIEIKSNEIHQGIAKIETSYDSIEIVIYYFSQGIEVYTLTDNSDITYSLKKGKVKYFLKCKRDKKLKKVIFDEVRGKTKEELMGKLIISLNKRLKRL